MMEGMTAPGFALFDTAIGRCAVGWTENGIAAVGLPESSPMRTGRRLLRRLPGAVESVPPPHVARAVATMTGLLAGDAADLSDVVLDLDGVADFQRRVYEVTRTIPAGSTYTYGQVAAAVGMPGAAQAVGRALGANPFPILVPCHRVVALDGSLGGFSGAGGVETKRRMLLAEGATGVAPTLF
jgi:methylated-DNA-[protein]-cysteine S-methyltransferase